MDKKQTRMFYVLFLGYTVLHTDAVVTITPLNVLSDGISFEEGSEGVIMCKINPYQNYFTWKIDNRVAADCLPGCSTYPAAAGNYSFTFDEVNGIFNITITSVNGTDDGKVFLCDDGSNPVNFTVRVKEKITLIDKTVTDRCWCRREKMWCVLVICLSILFGGYIVQCIVVMCRRRNIKNKGHEVETKLLKIEKKLVEKREQFRVEVKERDNEWRAAEVKELDQLDKKREQGMAGQVDGTEGKNQALTQYFKNKSTILKDLKTKEQKIQSDGKEELRRRRVEIRKIYKNKLERQFPTKEEKKYQLTKKLGEMEKEINDTIESLQEGKHKWRNRIADLETDEENYRKMIVNETIIQEPLTSDTQIQLDQRHQQNGLRIKGMEQEMRQKRTELCLIKKNREKNLKDMGANKMDTLKEMIAERETALEKLKQESRASGRRDRLAIYSAKRDIIPFQRESRERTLMFEIVELEEKYGALPVDDLKNEENEIPNSNIVHLINEIELKEEKYEKIIIKNEQEDKERENIREESSCMKCLPFIPCVGLIILCSQAAKKSNKDDNKRRGAGNFEMSKK